jgi:hypothetical protein
MGLRERVLNYLEERRERILNGQVNSIPTPFPRFADDFIGIEQSTYYTVTSFTKGKVL